MEENKIKNIFIKGSIDTNFISESIRKHNSMRNIGGHSIFLGQVRADILDGKQTSAIEYTANETMALEKMHEIRQEIFGNHHLTCMHVYHSLGKINAGEICLFVLTSASHRKAAINACEEIVEKIKTHLPIWGKELFEDETYQWKVNL